MAQYLGNAGEPQRGASRDEGTPLVATRSGVASRQRLLRCLAISALLHLLLILSLGASLVGAAGGLRATPPPELNAALSAFLLQRVPSNKDDDVSNEAPVVPLEPPAKNAAATAPSEPEPSRSDAEPSHEIPARGIIPLAEPYYFRASELEVRPRVLSDVQPQFPPSAADGASGRIVLRLLINEAGWVDTVLVERSELSQAFQDSAIEAFSGALFTPGKIGGIVVKSQILIEVTYEQAE